MNNKIQRVTVDWSKTPSLILEGKEIETLDYNCDFVSGAYVLVIKGKLK